MSRVESLKRYVKPPTSWEFCMYISISLLFFFTLVLSGSGSVQNALNVDLNYSYHHYYLLLLFYLQYFTANAAKCFERIQVKILTCSDRFTEVFN